jgi:hypothetical protein
MKNLALLPSALLLLTSCSSGPEVQKATTTDYRKDLPGGTLVETYKLNLTVDNRDVVSHKVTFVAPDGSRNTFTAGAGNRTFNKLKVGDQVQATVIRQLVVFLRKDGAPLSDSPAIAAALAPDKDSDMAKSDTVERVAKVGSMDVERRQARLLFPDGTSKTFPVRTGVDLARIKPGDEVVIRTRSAVMLPRN